MRHAIEGLREFATRYGRAFAAVWRVRDQLDSPKRSAEEVAFLPARLELVESPVSPLARWVIGAIVALFCVALAWAILGKLDIVAVASGKTVVSSRTKVVQPLETGVVRQIHVRDGQVVRRGDVLVELDATSTGAELEQADEALMHSRLAELRFSAMLDAMDSGRLPAVAEIPGVPLSRLQNEWKLLESEFIEYQARRQSLNASIVQRQAEAGTVRSQLAPLEESLSISKERVADLERLLDGQYVSRHEFLARKQESVELERLLAAQRSTLVETQSAMVAAQEDLLVLEADTRQQSMDGLRQAREQVAQYRPQSARAQRRDALMQLRAPVDGTVQQLAVHTVGGVVTPAQALMAIVPSEETLEIEATVLNKDVGFVRPGQRATVKVESFPYTRYGYLEGVVETVSHDAAQHEQLGLVFPARVKLESATLVIDGVRVALTPGMNLSVEIKTGKRRVIDYLLSPLRQHTNEALRER